MFNHVSTLIKGEVYLTCRDDINDARDPLLANLVAGQARKGAVVSLGKRLVVEKTVSALHCEPLLGHLPTGPAAVEHPSVCGGLGVRFHLT